MRLILRWFVMHGFLRLVAGRAAAAGDLQARLIGDPDVREDPTGLYAEIRARGPVATGRLAAITVDHGVVHEVLRSDDFRTIILGSRLPGPLGFIERHTRSTALHPLRPPSLLATEPPQHTSYRKMVSSVFTARAVAAMRENVEDTAARLLDDLDGRAGTVDIVAEYCAKLPVTVIGDILGVPEAERDQVLHFGELAAPSLDLGLPWGQFRRVEHGIEGFNDWLADHLDALRTNPGDDLMSQLIRATDDGVSLTDEELRGIAGLVLAAGFETTVNILGSGIDLLTRHPDQLALLQEDPSLWANAADEMLRLRSPVQMTARSAVRTTEVGGVSFDRGELIILVLAGANRDPAVFTDPDRFDVTRSNAAKHHSFSGGRHYCLGAALARAETEVGLRALFDRYPDLREAGTPVRRDTRVLQGYSSMPVILGDRSTARA
ncbi:cytochrome P450 [Williamsia deligens]|uniref:Cytochrome P450 n=1 Tax=Williamsia deligens TaxID=321325 RepID=A0ABW3GAQ6_9NOCA|nr:cytochrome P450 [Williamsia deligens]MCP2195160.1 Cytochrome P450 [Williamsia deligens]